METKSPDKAPAVPIAERIVRVVQLLVAVAYHDFSHEMSEDRVYLERGRREKTDIKSRERVLGDRALADAIWNHFAPGYWQYKRGPR